MLGRRFKKLSAGAMPDKAQVALSDGLQNLTPEQNRMMMATSLVAAAALGYKNSQSVQDIVVSMGTYTKLPDQEGYAQYVDRKAGLHVEANDKRVMIYVCLPDPPKEIEEMLELTSTSLLQMSGQQIGTNTTSGAVEGSLSRFFECDSATKQVARLTVGPVRTPFVSKQNEPLNGLMVDVTFGLGLPGYTLNT